jgi:tripartite ATP-independent transporter DctM subunit
MSALLFGGIGALALLGLPLFVVILFIALVQFPTADIPIADVFLEMEKLIHHDVLGAIALFTVAGFILAESGAAKRIVRVTDAILGWAHGGLAIVTVITLAFFTTFTGASGVTIIALGGLLWPLLLKRKYPKKFSLGLITASGSIGLLFFPALPVFYCATVFGMGTSSGYDIMMGGELIRNYQVTPERLFLAALIPGILMVSLVVAYAMFTGWKHKVERTRVPISEVIAAFKGGFFEIMLPSLLLYLAVSGTVGFEDIALITVLYLFIVEVLIYKDIDIFKDLPRISTDSIQLVGAIVVILAAVTASNHFLTTTEVPQKLVGYLRENVHNEIWMLVGLNILLLVVGCLMDIFSALAAVLPLLVPLAMVQVGADGMPMMGEDGTPAGVLLHPLHLGVIFLANLELGFITPPVGMNLFISGLHFKQRVLYVARAVLPFLGIMAFSVLIITYYKPLSTALPDHFIPPQKLTQEIQDDLNAIQDEDLSDYLTEDDCANGVDDDEDELVDCADDDCEYEDVCMKDDEEGSDTDTEEEPAEPSDTTPSPDAGSGESPGSPTDAQ